MSDKEIMKIFSDLEIEVKDISQYYTPEDFGRDLLLETNRSISEISYSGKAHRDCSEKNTTAVYG